MSKNKKPRNNLKKVDMVIIEDDKILADTLAVFFQNKSLTVDLYYSPKDFLENIARYSYKTKICIDYMFENDLMNGVDLAHLLYTKGFKSLYLLSGYDFTGNTPPDFVTPVMKTDMQALHKIATEETNRILTVGNVVQ